jgi:hypothetical protein
MSQFIDNSKHAAMTAAVESHIMGPGKARTMPGEASGKGMPLYGDSQYNNVSVPGVPDGSGFNYTPDSAAGHTTK